jgi:hypothetical protein
LSPTTWTSAQLRPRVLVYMYLMGASVLSWMIAIFALVLFVLWPIFVFLCWLRVGPFARDWLDGAILYFVHSNAGTLIEYYMQA